MRRRGDWLEFVGQIVSGEMWNGEIENALGICRAAPLVCAGMRQNSVRPGKKAMG